jgi:TolB-like protein/DNA-binding winged helix-turn-helix (wHTH) protein/Tfp pilus assembly protein PilF
MPVQDSDQVFRFAAFELDLNSGELRRSGVRLPVYGRPLQVLAVLLRTPGQLVTTDQLRTELWPADTFVDFEHGVRNAVARLRAVLGDTADRPRYIETLPRRGYRFIGVVAEVREPEVEAAKPSSVAAPPVEASPVRLAEASGRGRLFSALIALGGVISLAGAGMWFSDHLRARPAGVRIRSVAVLPLENLSGDPAQDYFADGVTDELIMALAKSNSAKVISRTSVMQYKGVHNKSLPQIARELGVDAIVEGTLARSGDRVRVTAQLIEAATDRHVWADRFERSSRDILLVENEIARTIAEQLQGTLSPQQQHRFRAAPIDPGAHEAYLQGRYLWNRRTPRALEEAVRYFTEAVEKDPRYAVAYAARADAYNVLGSWSFEAIPPAEARSKASRDVEKALQLDEASAEAHTTRASIRWLYEWNARETEMEFRRAIQLNPSYAVARQWYGQFLCNVERFEECLAETARAHALDPAYLIAAADVGFRLYEARRSSEAIPPLRKLVEFNPDFAVGRRYLGEVYEANRMYPAALQELRKAVELSGGSPVDLAALGHAYAVSGDRDEARKALHVLDELAKHRYVSKYERAVVLAGLAENDEALASLEQAFQERSSWMTKLNVDHRLDGLRGDARFSSLLRRVGIGR